MCSAAAITIAQMGVQATQTYLAAAGQNERAKATWDAAKTDLLGKYTATQVREQQEMASTSQRIFNTQKTGMTDVARVRTAAAAAGVAGRSADERVESVNNAVSDVSQTMRENLAMELEQNQLDAEGFKAKTQSIINENPTQSPLATGLDLAGGVLGGASKVASVQPPVSGAGTPGDINAVGAIDPAAGLNLAGF